MLEGLGGGVKVDVVCGPSVELKMRDEGRAEGGLRRMNCQRSVLITSFHPSWPLTFPAPAGPITMTPNLLISSSSTVPDPGTTASFLRTQDVMMTVFGLVRCML
jgi:hypothetical protein